MPKKVTREEFIKRSKEVHGDKYDYSLVEYNTLEDIIKIICPIHGVFEQKAWYHLKHGCKKCGFMVIKLTQEEYIKRVRKKHGDKFDYSLVDYKGMNYKIKIICPIHGVFEQQAKVHLHWGCKKCSDMSLRKTQEDFLKKAKITHGDKYDYSLVDYVDRQTKIKIICQKHGIFTQIPSDHIRGNGCPNCAHDNLRLTQEEFIIRSNKIHKNKYDYSLVEYKSTYKKVKIICPIHGVFEQIPMSHLKGIGCSACTNNKKKTTEEFIKEARKIHGDRYDYSLVEYKNNTTKVKIICPVHGVFEQGAKEHLRGHGCLQCSSSYGYGKGYIEFCEKNNIETYFYIVRLFNNKENFVKIGITTNKTNSRFNSIKYLSGYDFEILSMKEYAPKKCDKLEKKIKKKYKSIQYIPKNYFCGKTECFYLELLSEKFINSLI